MITLAISIGGWIVFFLLCMSYHIEAERLRRERDESRKMSVDLSEMVMELMKDREKETE